MLQPPVSDSLQANFQPLHACEHLAHFDLLVPQNSQLVVVVRVVLSQRRQRFLLNLRKLSVSLVQLNLQLVALLYKLLKYRVVRHAHGALQRVLVSDARQK